MIEGRFGGTSGRPQVEGTIYFPRFDVEALVSFVVDTGADTTTVSPEVIQRAGIPYNMLGNIGEARGIGGATSLFREKALIHFLDSETELLYVFGVVACVLPFSPEFQEYPSLLGRDVLNRCRLVCDGVSQVLEIEPLQPDDVIIVG